MDDISSEKYVYNKPTKSFVNLYKNIKEKHNFTLLLPVAYYSLFHKTFKLVPYLFILCITYNSLLLKETIMQIRLSLKKIIYMI